MSSTENTEGRFTIKKITKFSELVEGEVIELPESDLCFQNEERIIQMKYERAEEDKKYEIEPGIYTLAETSAGIVTQKVELKTRILLETVDNTKQILKEAKIFFSKLHVYERLGRPKKRGVLLYSKPGMGKCLSPETPIIMFDGSIKKAKDVMTGDKLMGPDSKPRNVLGTTSGRDTMYKITPVKGDPYTVNSAHILSLQDTDTKEVVNINVEDYLALNKTRRSRLKGWRAPAIDFKPRQVTMPARLLGMWLGDGTSSKAEICTADEELVKYIKSEAARWNLKLDDSKVDGKARTYRFASGTAHGKKNRNEFINQLKKYKLLDNKHIPDDFKYTDRASRLALLAGLMDTDGSLIENNVFDIVSKFETLANDIAYVARSLGLAAYVKPSFKRACNSPSHGGSLYYRVSISGDTVQIPTLLKRKQAKARKQIKSVLRTGISVAPVGKGNYNGFELDGDHLFLLGDFTVTHNTSAIEKFCADAVAEDAGTVVLIWPTSDIEADSLVRFLTARSEYTAECTRLILIIEDIGGGERDGDHGRSGVDSGLLNLLDGIGVTFKLPTFIVATTNHPENLLESLADRPGRFDLMLELNPPTREERVALLAFVSKRDLTDIEIEAIQNKGTDNFSIAHLEEIPVRAELHDKSYVQVIRELVEHSERFKKAFDKKGGLGIGSMFQD